MTYRYVIIPFLLVYVLVAGCTYTITMVQTDGKAADVVDETATNTPNISPTVSIPAL